jgi:hypothetical protein
MSEKIELEAGRDFSDIMSDTFVLVRQNFSPLIKAYFVICGLFLLTCIIISALYNLNSAEPTLSFLYGFITIVFGIFNGTAIHLTILSYYVIYKEKGNIPPSVFEVWGYFKYYYFRVLGTHFLSTIGIAIGAIFCFVPGIYLGIVFSLVTPIMVIENGGLEYSYKKAFKLIKGNWWFTFGTLLLTFFLMILIVLALMVPAMAIYGGTQWLTGKNLDAIGAVVQAVMLNLSNILSIIPLTALTLVYFTLIDEKEGTSLIKRMQSFGAKNTDATDTITEQY